MAFLWGRLFHECARGWGNYGLVTTINEACLFTVSWAPNSLAQGTEPIKPSASTAFEFRSHRIGDALDTSYPKWRQGKKDYSKPGCEGPNEVGVVSCDDEKSFEKPKGSTLTQRRVGDVYIKLLSYKFFEGRLYSLDMVFYVSWHSRVRDLLVGKYGEPNREQISQIQNRAGANFENLMTEWDFQEGTLKLEMRYGRFDTSWLKFENRPVEVQIQALRRVITQQKGKSAF